MSVSKRARYEVLRRDNHTCRYCGATAPDATLTVDHVTPVALGGGDDPGNLVAACRDCNAGKSSSSPDATMVAAVSEDAIRWATALQMSMDAAKDDWAGRELYRTAFQKAWKRHDRRCLTLPKSWVSTLNTWHGIGVPIELLTEAVDIAFGQDKVANGDVFRYACGIVWRRLDKIRDTAQPDHATPAQPCGHCYPCRGMDDEGSICYHLLPLAEDEDPDNCPVCGETGCPWSYGYDEGSSDAYQQAFERGRRIGEAQYALRDVGHRALEAVVDWGL